MVDPGPREDVIGDRSSVFLLIQRYDDLTGGVVHLNSGSRTRRSTEQGNSRRYKPVMPTWYLTTTR